MPGCSASTRTAWFPHARSRSFHALLSGAGVAMRPRISSTARSTRASLLGEIVVKGHRARAELVGEAADAEVLDARHARDTQPLLLRSALP
jgi:hypothetical protein